MELYLLKRIYRSVADLNRSVFSYYDVPAEHESVYFAFDRIPGDGTESPLIEEAESLKELGDGIIEFIKDPGTVKLIYDFECDLSTTFDGDHGMVKDALLTLEEREELEDMVYLGTIELNKTQ